MAYTSSAKLEFAALRAETHNTLIIAYLIALEAKSDVPPRKGFEKYSEEELAHIANKNVETIVTAILSNIVLPVPETVTAYLVEEAKTGRFGRPRAKTQESSDGRVAGADPSYKVK